MKINRQSGAFRGIYEFEDPSGCLIAAKIPPMGSADLYSGTALVVRPNQCAMFLYKGQIGDIFLQGTHSLKSENVPILTRLANWRFGFKSPLRCEIWFFSSQIFTARRWGTAKPVLVHFKETGDQPVPIRAYGMFNLRLKDPRHFYATLLGSRTSYDISELEDFVQAQICEVLPQALESVQSLKQLNRQQDQVSQQLEKLVNKVLLKYGVRVVDIQVMSILPSDEVLKAMNARTAMNIVGSKQEYLMYQAANSLNELQSSGGSQGNDPMQMMMGLMLGKNLMASDYREKEREVRPRMLKNKKRARSAGAQRQSASASFCPQCGHRVRANDRFCSSCGGRLR